MTFLCSKIGCFPSQKFLKGAKSGSHFKLILFLQCLFYNLTKKRSSTFFLNCFFLRAPCIIFHQLFYNVVAPSCGIGGWKICSKMMHVRQLVITKIKKKFGCKRVKNYLSRMHAFQLLIIFQSLCCTADAV